MLAGYVGWPSDFCEPSTSLRVTSYSPGRQGIVRRDLDQLLKEAARLRVRTYVSQHHPKDIFKFL